MPTLLLVALALVSAACDAQTASNSVDLPASPVAPSSTPGPLAPTPPDVPRASLSPTVVDLTSIPLGQPVGPGVTARSVVLQRFQNGVMVVFARSGQGFADGGEFIFALARDGRAWRIADTFVEKSKSPDDWYTCDAKPGLRPERSGVPWRGFGKAWCEHPEVRLALGSARSYEEAELTADFQGYERGRSFRLSDWRGIPGWDKDRFYRVVLDSSDPQFATGHWE